MKAHLIDTHLLVPRSRSSAKVKVKYQSHVSQKMGVSGALVFHKHILFLDLHYEIYSMVKFVEILFFLPICDHIKISTYESNQSKQSGLHWYMIFLTLRNKPWFLRVCVEHHSVNQLDKLKTMKM